VPRGCAYGVQQLEAGREIPPPPDYAGMLADVRDEVSENFAFPKDAAGKVKKTKMKKDDSTSGDSDDSEDEEEGEDEEDEAPEAEE
jgi:hypothetical protein